MCTKSLKTTNVTSFQKSLILLGQKEWIIISLKIVRKFVESGQMFKCMYNLKSEIE